MLTHFLLACLGTALPPADELAAALDAARPAAEVVVRVRFLCLVDDGSDRVGIDFDTEDKVPVRLDGGRLRVATDELFRDGGRKPVVLDGEQARVFLAVARADARTRVLAGPALKATEGRTALFCTGGSRPYVTGLALGQVGGAFVLLPRREPVETGLSLSVRPELTPDRRGVRVHLKASLKAENGAPVSVPVEVRIRPPEGDEGSVKPVSVTQTVQQPRLIRLETERELTIPDGGSVLLAGCRTRRTGRNEYGPPVLSSLPYVGRLFRNVGYGHETESVVVMVSASICPRKEAEARAKRR